MMNVLPPIFLAGREPSAKRSYIHARERPTAFAAPSGEYATGFPSLVIIGVVIAFAFLYTARHFRLLLRSSGPNGNQRQQRAKLCIEGPWVWGLAASDVDPNNTCRRGTSSRCF